MKRNRFFLVTCCLLFWAAASQSGGSDMDIRKVVKIMEDGDQQAEKQPQKSSSTENNDYWRRIDTLQNKLKGLSESVNRNWDTVSRRRVAENRRKEIETDLNRLETWYYQELDKIRNYKISGETLPESGRQDYMARLADRCKQVEKIYREESGKLRHEKAEWLKISASSDHLYLPPVKPPLISDSAAPFPETGSSNETPIPDISIEEAETILNGVDEKLKSAGWLE